MPIRVGVDLRRMDDEEFKQCAYDVMSQVFSIQKKFRRLFHESIYQRELTFRVANARREVPIEVRFEDFCKTYYLDLLVQGGAAFELKAVESLTERHRRQLLQYLFLIDLPHGKLVNLRRRFLDCSDLRAIQWLNITRQLVRFKTIQKT